MNTFSMKKQPTKCFVKGTKFEHGRGVWFYYGTPYRKADGTFERYDDTKIGGAADDSYTFACLSANDASEPYFDRPDKACQHCMNDIPHTKALHKNNTK